MISVPSISPGAAGKWLQELDARQRAVLRTLHRIDTRWNWVCLLYPAAWLVAVILMNRFPHWYVRVPAALIVAVSIQAVGILMHEALHGNLFGHRGLDRWACTIFGAAALFSGSAYRIVHLNHHRHTRTDKDQDEISNLCRTNGQYQILFRIWFFAGTFVYMFVVPWKALSIASASDQRRVLAEYAILIAIYATFITATISEGHVNALVWNWLIPVQIAMMLSNIRGVAEHLGTGTEGVESRTRTTTSTRIVSFLMCNLNYHLEHHLFPGVPWYNLPKLHTLLAPRFEEDAAFIESSYLAYALRAFRAGPLRQIRASKWEVYE